MFTYTDGSLYLADSKIADMSYIELVELGYTLSIVDPMNIPTLTIKDDISLKRDEAQFEKEWRKDKLLRPNIELVARQGRVLLAANLAGMSWYVTKLDIIPDSELYQLSTLGVYSRAANITDGWYANLDSLINIIKENK